MTTTVTFETQKGSGVIECIIRDETGRNNTFDVIVEDTFEGFTEEQVYDEINDNILDYVGHLV